MLVKDVSCAPAVYKHLNIPKVLISRDKEGSFPIISST
jgi:hypothetical protein